MDQDTCEAPHCSLPGTTCLLCQHCFCWKHLQRSSCEYCHTLLFRGSFERRLARLVGSGLWLFLVGVLLLLLPPDPYGIDLQLAISLLLVGALLAWLGVLVRM